MVSCFSLCFLGFNYFSMVLAVWGFRHMSRWNSVGIFIVQLWDSVGTVLGQLPNSFGALLGRFGDSLGTVEAHD